MLFRPKSQRNSRYCVSRNASGKQKNERYIGQKPMIARAYTLDLLFLTDSDWFRFTSIGNYSE